MLLQTIVYDSNREEIADELNRIKQYFQSKGTNLGLSESIEDGTHFIKIFCEDYGCTEKFINTFNILISEMLYSIVIEEFYNKDMMKFLTDTYFFLKYDEIADVRQLSMKALKSDGPILDENMVYCINRKNSTIKKIVRCLEENSEINIKGFLTFRMKELREDIEDIIDKVVEKYMVEKEYDEFIKLLKYFVEIQESKIELVNIYIQSDGNYQVKDQNGKDVSDKLFSDLSEARYTGTVGVEDMLISGLITNSPERIVIHCVENCSNKELIDTIKNVFLSRVTFCSNCSNCKAMKVDIKV